MSNHAHRPALHPLEPRQLLAAGALDPTFGAGGKEVLGALPVGLHLTAGSQVITLPDGKSVLLAGDANGAATHLVRLNPDGSLDTSFGAAGVASVDANPLPAPDRFAQLDETPLALVQLPDGKYLVAGRIWKGDANVYLARFNADGSLDTSFATAGIKKFTFDDGHAHVSLSLYMAAQPDGKILLAGTHQTNTGAGPFDQDIQIRRLNADGSTDTSFGVNGSVFHPGVVTDLLVQPDGRILVAGNQLVQAGAADPTAYTAGNAFVWRLNANGSTDNSFGAAGVAALPTPAGLRSAVDRIALTPDGHVLAIATAYSSDHAASTAIVYKIAADGTHVSTVTVPAPAGTSLSFHRVLVDPDGKVYLAGLIADGPANADHPLDSVIARLNPDLSVDNSFATGGFFRTSFGPADGSDQVTALALTASGKLLAAGIAPAEHQGVNGGDIAVLRLTLDDVPTATPARRPRSPKRIAMELAARAEAAKSHRSPKRIALEQAAIKQAVADALAAGSHRSPKQLAADFTAQLAAGTFSTARIAT